MKSSKLDNLRQRVEGNQKSTINTEFYLLAKELGCLPDLFGREYEVEYEGDKIKRIIQKPMAMSTFICMMKELIEDYNRQERASRKGRRKK